MTCAEVFEICAKVLVPKFTRVEVRLPGYLMPIKTALGHLGLNSPVNLNIFCDKIVNTLSSDLSRASSYDNYIASMHERVILKSLAFIFYLMVIVQESENSSANRTVLARFPRTH